MNYKRALRETQDDFFVRIGKEVMLRNLTWAEAAKVFNEDTGGNYGECAYRKKFKAFYSGMLYQQKKNSDGVSTRILTISDLHIPYHHAVEVFAEYAGAVDILQLNGDIVDCQSISRFPKTYRKSPMEEILTARKYLIDLIYLIRPKKVIVNYGNHDLRFQNYLAKNVDTDLIELMPKTPLELILVDGFNHYNKELHTKVHYDPLTAVFDGDVEIEYIDGWYSMIGKTIFCHPIAFSSGIMQTAEKARRYFKDEGFDFTSLVMAHTHRTGHYDIGNTTIYEQGAACDTKKMNYSDGRLTASQREGFMYICQNNEGNIMEDHTKIIRLN